MKNRFYKDKDYVEYDNPVELFTFEVQPHYKRQREYSRKNLIYPLPILFDFPSINEKGGNSEPYCFFRYCRQTWLVTKDSKLMPFFIAKEAFEKEENPFIIIEKQTLKGRTKLKLKESLIDNLIQEFNEQKAIWRKLGWNIKINTPTWERQGFNVYGV